MSKKTLKSDSFRVNEKEFRKSKQPTALNLINVDEIVVSEKCRNSDDGFRYFIGYKAGENVKPLCIILAQMTGYIKYFENSNKNISFMVKDDDVLDNYNKIWKKTKEMLSINFCSMPVYDEKYAKAKVREFNGVIKTNLLDNKIQKENKYYTFISCLSIDSVMRIEKKNCPQVYLEECKYKVKKTKIRKFVEAELKSESESKSGSKFVTELMN